MSRLTGFHQRVDHVLIQRFAEGTGLLRAVEHAEALDRLRQGFDELRRNKWTVQANFQHAELRALLVEVFNRFFRNVRTAAHENDHVLGIRRADIVEEVVLAAGDLGNFAHVVLDRCREPLRSTCLPLHDPGSRCPGSARCRPDADVPDSARGRGNALTASTCRAVCPCPHSRSFRSSALRGRCGSRRRNGETERCS